MLRSAAQDLQYLGARARADSAQARTQARQRNQDPHLHSGKAVAGHPIKAGGDETGHGRVRGGSTGQRPQSALPPAA